MKKALIVHKLKKVFEPAWFARVRGAQDFVAVKEISFSLTRGETLGFLGANGAGKTTTMQMLLGVLTPTSGSMQFNAQRIAFASGTMKLPSNLTVYECLRMYGLLYGMNWSHLTVRIEEMLDAFRIRHLAHKNSTRLSAGQTTTVILARTFLVEPDLILLDEPTATLDPENAQTIRQFIATYSKQHTVSMLFTSHNMAEVTELCDRIIVLKNGEIVADNTPERLAATVCFVTLTLLVVQNLSRLTEYLTVSQIRFELKEHDFIEIALDEQSVAKVLNQCAQLGVDYSSISVGKPTLEDYFIALMH
ncbi:MAG: ABC-type multidrug transport system, ATPase component [candidate division TM6 bacterium GW2011_GWE2_41_16]|nr:MAG: ABC-type multidrug transport system, ATPase component [candidate division TM6 bacterium GW2011_GWE2_41_16]